MRNCYVLPVDEMEQRLAHRNAELAERQRTHARVQASALSRESDKVVTVSHHLAHAYSAFAACPFDEGVVMVVDGVGSYAADVDGGLSGWRISQSARPRVARAITVQGIELEGAEEGLAESGARIPQRRVLQHARPRRAVQPRVELMFGDWNKCGELMGLAPYGRPDAIKPLLSIENSDLEVPDWGEEFNKPFLLEAGRTGRKARTCSTGRTSPGASRTTPRRCCCERARWLRETTGAKNLCISGGVGLNCVANGRIAREAGFDNVWIQPAAGDDGIAIGCAYYGHLAIQKKSRTSS